MRAIRAEEDPVLARRGSPGLEVMLGIGPAQVPMIGAPVMTTGRPVEELTIALDQRAGPMRLAVSDIEFGSWLSRTMRRMTRVVRRGGTSPSLQFPRMRACAVYDVPRSMACDGRRPRSHMRWSWWLVENQRATYLRAAGGVCRVRTVGPRTKVYL